MKKIILLFLMLITGNIHAQINNNITVQVSQSSDDAEESENGTTTDTGSSDLELVFDSFDSRNNQTVGIRFQNINVPENATITNAYIQFWADETHSTFTNLTIKGELAQNSTTFSETSNNISSRTTTSTQATWLNVPAWNSTDGSGENQKTPDLSLIVKEIITSNNWAYGNSMTFIITGSSGSKRVAKAYDDTASKAPSLFIEYTIPKSAIDLGVKTISGINEYNTVQNDVVITTVIQNYGISTVDNFTVSYALDNGTPVSETVNVSLASNETYTHNFAQTLDLTNIGEHTITVSVDATGDTTNFNNSIEKKFNVIEEFSSLYFETSSSWKYLDDGSDLGTQWINPDFDDSSWTYGAGQFGFGESDEDISLNSGHVTYYFRKKVNIEDINQINTVVMNLLADDAAVVYVNGQEAIRSVNMPEGMISSSTTATRSSTDDFENTPLNYNLDPALFQTGLNTIAIEVHNVSPSSSDISFSCEIINQPIVYSLDGPYVFYRNNQIIVKTITENGPVINTYAKDSNPTLTCNLPNGDSFDFKLAKNLEIPNPAHDIPNEFYVTSDVEGQIEAFTFLLKNAKIIDENYNWIYGQGHLYFVGDAFDRGNYVTQSIWLLYKLEQEAKIAGGGVHFILGNHEMINFTQDYRYVQEKYYQNASHVGEMLDDMYIPESELGAWFRTKNIIENAGQSAIFLHGGISPDVSNLNLTLEQINDYGRIGIDDPYCRNGNNDCQTVNGGSDQGIYWYRGITQEKLEQAEVDEIMTNSNGDKMILAHTIFPEITTLYNNKVIAVDVDHESNFNNGYMEALYYNDGCYYRFVTNGTDNTLTPLDSGCDNLATKDFLKNDKVQIIPSLFTSQVSIHYPDSFKDKDVYVYDIMGKLIKQSKLLKHQNILKLNTSAWGRGMYFVKIKLGEQSIVQKIIKK